MTSFSNLLIFKQLSKDSRLTSRSTFFGLIKKYSYIPTNSQLVASIMEYTPTDGIKIERCLNGKNKLEQIQGLTSLGKLEATSLGNYMLEEVHSKDLQFIAIRLYQFKQLNYEPVTETCIFEGRDAEQVISALL